MAESIKGPLELLVPRLVRAAQAKWQLSENEACTLVYDSELYAKLEVEETKLWHLSVPALLQLLEEERATGQITYPEEA
ncbi:MAG: hypothetical protein LBR73_07130 [Oscillospiraceae bacterium]|jgi:hypothetical protein|nr:hypothetical protein [Oscillospiraceae bacterium]